MRQIILWLRKLCGILFVAVGFLTGVVGICWAVILTSLWFKGDPFSQGDRRAWLACMGVGIGGSLLFWAGAALLRAGGAVRNHDGSFRLRMTSPQQRRSVNAGWGGTVALLFVVAEVCLFYFHEDAPTKTRHVLEGVLAVYFGLHGLIFLHELGHLCVAAVFGFDLQKLQVGTGHLIFKGKLGGLYLEWRALLGGGLMFTADHRERGWRWRHWLYVAGGPAATTVVCLILAWWIEQRHPGGRWLAGSDGVADIVAVLLCALSAMFWLGCLLPMKTRIGTVHAHTDGYQLLHTPRFNPEKVRTVIAVTWLRRVDMLWSDDRHEAAWEHFREFVRRYPDNKLLPAIEGNLLREQGDHRAAADSYLRCLQADDLPEAARAPMRAHRFAALARANEMEAARQCCADALSKVAPAQRAAQLDALATEAIKLDSHTFLPEADVWTQEALALEPASVTLKGTRGAVLVELGRFDEGEALLREVWATSASEVDAAISAFYLGIAAKRHGQKNQTLRWFGRSKGFAPFVGQWLLEKIARETAPAPLEPAAIT